MRGKELDKTLSCGRGSDDIQDEISFETCLLLILDLNWFIWVLKEFL